MIDYALLRILGIVSLLQFWWVAIWGFCYMGIEYLTKRSIITEFWIYTIMLVIVYGVLLSYPSLISNIAVI
jgi:hypothetical protein